MGVLAQPIEEVRLQRLSSRSRSSAQNPVHFGGDLLDLNAGHGAIMALLPPKDNRSAESMEVPVTAALDVECTRATYLS